MPLHLPVLTNQVIRFLEPKPGKIFIDCTLGVGGHTESLITQLGNNGAVYGIEVDDRNLQKAQERLKPYSHVHYIRDNFENLEKISKDVLAKEGRIDGILFDLGLSSLHVDESERGFSFQSEGPLDMRFDTRQPLTAAKIANTYSLKDLQFIFQIYGEEKFSYRIAKEMVEHRRSEPFTTTLQLANCIANIFSRGKKDFYFKRHPATRVFQALRIATNREVEVFGIALSAAIQNISLGGRIVIISYHSIEDRIAKNMFRDGKKEGTLSVLTKKPLEPEEEEVTTNRRSRSAKLRAAEKII